MRESEREREITPFCSDVVGFRLGLTRGHPLYSLRSLRTKMVDGAARLRGKGEGGLLLLLAPEQSKSKTRL